MRASVASGHSTPAPGAPTSSGVLTSPVLRAFVIALVACLGLTTAPARASGARVSGTVSINSKGTAAVRVAAFATDQDTRAEAPISETVSRKGGSFTLRLAPGDYRLMVDAGDRGYRPAWWRGAAGVAVATVSVMAGQVVTGISLRVTGTAKFPTAVAQVAVPVPPAGLTGLPVDDLAGYQGQTRCRKNPRSGTRALRSLILATYPAGIPAYTNRPCGGDTSEHYDGRAIDWMVNSRIAAQAQLGDSFAAWVTAARGSELGVVARRLGIMYIIWRGRIWKQYQAQEGWQAYSDCSRRSRSTVASDNECHRNHIHLSLTHDGARMRTSWWRAAALQ